MTDMNNNRVIVFIIGAIIAVIGLYFLATGVYAFRFYEGRIVSLISDLGYVGIALMIIGIVIIVVSLLIKSNGVSTTPYMTCPYCGYEVKPDYLRCPNCGAPLKKKCANCGNLVDAQAQFCPFCGSNQFIDLYQSAPSRPPV
jgi:RNA polymerase subunit RPABC4/transcription elongation factor Spt4